jgi:hypothetical protein
MKKFSKITGQIINEDPKVNLEINEKEVTKLKIVNLMDRLLRIRSYGSVDNRFLSGSVKIEGKEMLAEAILDFLSELSNKEQSKILEGLKSEIKDWDILDKKIDLLNKKSPLLENKRKFESFLERWKYDEGTLIMLAEFKSEKIKNKETILDYISIINESEISNQLKEKLKKIYQK